MTADAAQPNAFEEIDSGFLSAVGALAAAEMRTTHLIEALEQSARRQGLIARDLMRDVQLRQGSDMIGTTPVMQRLRQDIELVARSDFTVLITGETGVGKELVARAVHAASERRAEPMLYVNCAALPETLADSELFGHVRGAFTGATATGRASSRWPAAVRCSSTRSASCRCRCSPSCCARSSKARSSASARTSWSRSTSGSSPRPTATSSRRSRPGGSAPTCFTASTSTRSGCPPLRERVDDIPLLAGYFCDVMRKRLGLGPVRLDPEAVAALKGYRWPGNVRELENVLSRVTLKAAARITRGEPVVISQDASRSGLLVGSTYCWRTGTDKNRLACQRNIDLKEATREFQRSLIERALADNDGNWSAAARSLGMHRSNFHHLAVRLGLK